MLVFAVISLLILVVPLLARRLRIPGIVGLILTGVVVGPHGLGVLDRGPGVMILSTVGLLYIMFIAGLEIDLYQFRQQRNRALASGLVTFLAGQILGAWSGHALLGMSWPSAILFGSLFACHTIVPYPIVSRLGLARDIAVVMSVGATIVTDSLALLVLAAITSFAGAPVTEWHAVRLVVGLGLVVIAGVYVLPRLGRWFYRNYSGDDTAEFLFLFTGLLAVASLAQVGGLEPIIGAFMAGLALNSLVPEQSRLMNRVQFTGNTIFIPIFLLSVGMVVDLRAFLGGSRAWFVMGIMVALALVSKLLSAWTIQHLFKLSRDQGWLAFGLIVNKAAATLAIVLVGYNLGLLNADVLNGAVVVILVTCMVGPWVTDICARRMALRLAEGPLHVAEGPQRILVPLANPATAEALMNVAILARDRRSGQPIFPLNVAEDGPNVKAEIARIEKLMSQIVVHAAAADVPVRSETRIDTDVAAGIVKAVKELRASMIVVGWTGQPGTSQVLFGRVLDRVLAQTDELVLVCKLEQPLNTCERVVLVLPALAAKAAGFDEAIRTARCLTFQAGCSTVALSCDADPVALFQRIQSLTPNAGPVNGRGVQDWDMLWTELASLLRPNDLVILLSYRAGSLAWHPRLDRIPERFVSSFPKTGFLVIYPAEPPMDEEWTEDGHAVAAAVAENLLRADHVAFGLGSVGLAEAVDTVLGRCLAPNMALPAEKWQELRDALLPSRLELRPGVVLLHVHSEDVDVPVVLWALSEAGFADSVTSAPARVLLVLLSPASLPPDQHLQMLSSLARTILAAPNPAAIAPVRSIEDLRKALTPSGPRKTPPAQA
ncbi:MAG: hypothetical protein A3K19_20240 [Lentisphaerae bacterium RIFOXYB12_FULL_65_16]|nr:MAG: hypothetical protein A3K19_20240 [Lentisphaerae bacterium RIFOXYB12_FULL_65_16]